MPQRDWPLLTDIDTSSLDSQTDRPNRRHFLNAFQALWSVVRAKGRRHGLAELDGNRKVYGNQMGRDEANGVAPLNAQRKVPVANLPDFAGVPVGGIIPYAGGGPRFRGPSWDWAHCDGRWLRKTDYPALWDVCGNSYLGGETARGAEFRIPTMSGRYIRGGQGGGRGLGYGGAGSVRLTTAHMPEHRHLVGSGSYANAPAGRGLSPSAGRSMHIRRHGSPSDNSDYYLASTTEEPSHLRSGKAGAASPTPVPIDPPWVGLDWIIRTR